MQIADLTRQYSNTTSSSEAMNGTRGVEKLVSSVRDMAAGNIFEGTVNSVQNGKVVLGLSNGTELMARLDANMQLVRGQSMFFQVKSNNGETIAIRPYTVDGAGVNLTLLNALKAASLPVTEKYLNMANSMMQEQMPIDKNTMAQMARVLMANPDMSVNTLVQMKKLNIPITNEMVAQFENYMDDSSAVHKALDSFISELPSTMAGKDMPLEQLKAFDSQLLQVLAEGMDDMQAVTNTETGAQSVSENGTATGQTSASNVEVTVNEQGTPSENASAVQGSGAENSTNDVTAHIADTAMTSTISNGADVLMQAMEGAIAETEATKQNISSTQSLSGEVVEDAVSTEAQGSGAAQETVNENAGNSKATLQSQEQVLRLLHTLFGDTGITREDSPAAMLHKLSAFLLNGQNVSKDALNQLFSSKDMHQFLRDVLESQMYLTPEDVADTDKVKKLYERLESKTQNLQNLLASAGLNETPLAQTINNVHGNVEFMNQLNEAFTYMQIPLKMSGQNASGQLYVYTNKRDLSDPEKDLTAFLHLDLDHLGSTDVSVRLHRKDVDTKFYMDSDEAYDLVKKHMPELEERLKLKGFNCNMYVENGGKKVNFVEDFLKKDAPSTGQLHRYSFDVRA